MSIETEKKTIEQMIQLFCEVKHGTKKALCTKCKELLTYAEARLDHCPFGDNKPVCRNCEVRCYTPERRQQISEIMRFSGPRMLSKSPRTVFRHWLQTLKR